MNVKKILKKLKQEDSVLPSILLWHQFGFSAGGLSNQQYFYNIEVKTCVMPRPLQRQVGYNLVQYHLFIWSIHST